MTLREEFLLERGIIFLNHGSFGACPRPVFETYQAWQRELERQPVEFLGQRAGSLLAEARQKLAAFLNVQADETVFFTNPTTALNMVIRNLAERGRRKDRSGSRPVLQAGDEVLTTAHE